MERTASRAARWSDGAGRAVEALLLLAVVCVPLFAQPHGFRGFDADRFVVLRLFGVAALVALAAEAAFAPRDAPRRRVSAADVLVLLYLGASLVAAFTSIAPAAALPGSYDRQQGLLSDVALVGLYLAARRSASRGAPAALVCDGFVAAGAAIAALALVQVLLPAGGTGFDVPYAEEGGRASGSAGGPTFLGSHLAAALALLAGTARTRAAWGALVLLALALVATGSRAALLAAVLGVLFVAALDRARRKRLLSGLAVAALLLGVACLPMIRGALPSGSLPQRLVEAATTDQAGTRALLYRRGALAIAEAPERLAFGHGPDAAGVAFQPHVGPELQRRLGGAVVVDRLHCDLLDVVYSRGLLAAVGLYGLLALSIGAAFRRARRLGSDPAAPEDRGAIVGLGGLLVALAIDGLLSVPGAVSRSALFVAAGWLAGRSAGGAPAAGDPPGQRGALLGAAAVTFAFAIGDVRFAWLGAPLLLLLPRDGRARAGGRAALLFVAFLIGRQLLPSWDFAGADFHSETAALRGRLDTMLLLTGLCAALFLLGRALPSRGRPAAARRPRPLWTGALLLALLVGGSLASDDVRRLFADVDARAADDAERVGRRPDRAATLLERAAAAAPEVSRYKTRAALALAAWAADLPDQAAPEREALLLRAGTHLGRVLEKEPGDALARAEGAAAVLAFARLLDDHRHGLIERAWLLVEPALSLAPTSAKVAQAAAEVALARGDVEAAVAILEEAIAIDASSARSWALKGRAEAARRNLSGAAFAYGRANVAGAAREGETGVVQRARTEALAGLALAAAATERTKDAATLVLLLADRVLAGTDLAADVKGARPLLWFVKDHAFAGTFEEARERATPDALPRVALVESALTY